MNLAYQDFARSLGFHVDPCPVRHPEAKGKVEFAFQPAVERRKIETLATTQWIRDRQALLLLGPPGVGKSLLAAGLGVATIERGLSVVFCRIEELLHDLRRDARMPPAHLKRRKCMNATLLIVDEVGFEPFPREDANLFFRLISYRYRRGAILITSNKSIRDWPRSWPAMKPSRPPSLTDCSTPATS